MSSYQCLSRVRILVALQVLLLVGGANAGYTWGRSEDTYEGNLLDKNEKLIKLGTETSTILNAGDSFFATFDVPGNVVEASNMKLVVVKQSGFSGEKFPIPTQKLKVLDSGHGSDSTWSFVMPVGMSTKLKERFKICLQKGDASSGLKKFNLGWSSYIKGCTRSFEYDPRPRRTSFRSASDQLLVQGILGVKHVNPELDSSATCPRDQASISAQLTTAEMIESLKRALKQYANNPRTDPKDVEAAFAALDQLEQGSKAKTCALAKNVAANTGGFIIRAVLLSGKIVTYGVLGAFILAATIALAAVWNTCSLICHAFKTAYKILR